MKNCPIQYLGLALGAALQLAVPVAAQSGLVEKLDGGQLTGEISFADALVTVSGDGGETQSIPIAEVRHATFSVDPDGGAEDLQLARNGLRGRYFSNIKHDGVPVERIDPLVSFDWGEAAPADGITPNGFSVRWEGEVQVPVGGEITFEVESDDGSRLWVDGQQLVDFWQAQGATPHSGKIQLEAGRRYAIRLEYYDAWSTAIARLRWKAEGLPYGLIPSECLFPLPLTSPGERKFVHEVKLKSGSALSGRITHADPKRVRLETAHGEVTIPTPAIGYLRFAHSWGGDLGAQLERRPPGCALLNRDYIEGEFKDLRDGIVKIESVLFGSRSVQQSELRAIKLAEQRPRAANYMLLTTDDTRMLVNAITTQPDGTLKIRDGSGYHLTLPQSLVRQIRTTSSRGEAH